MTLGCSTPPADEGDGSGTTGSTGSATGPTEGGSEPTGDGSSEGGSTTATTAGSDSSGGGLPPPVLDECIDDGSAGGHVYSCGAFDFDVTIPESCLDEPCGLIVDVHGFTMSGAMQEANTHLRQLGAARGYIVIQPNANPAPPASSWNPGVDDDAVVDFMLRVADAFHVDRDRLHLTGFSQGGYMSWRVVCEHADLLASVAPAAACGDGVIADCDFGPGNQPSEPVDILFMHGTQDVLVPYPCAPVRRDAVVAAYGLGPEQVVAEGDGYRWTRHEGDDGTVMEFITHEYSAANTVVLGGHCFPGSDDPGDQPGQLMSYACVEPTELFWGEAVLDFFDAHPRG
ncbi:MAG: hypothetical protein H6712_17135 [Myxococcales bacterium]|nr:hypothetical protein [Myxococcales bacterium]MCB9715596.1 hypothetical protein [Myxococcales bacterium]